MIGAHLVALFGLSGTADAAIGPLAADLGTTAYELRLTLAAGFPAIVLFTSDRARAEKAAAAVRARGHRGVLCDRADIVPSGRMTDLRDFRLGAALTANAGNPDTLPVADIGAILRATHRSTTVTTEEVQERKLRPGMAIATGGLVVSKKVTKEVTTRAEERQQVLYLFRRSGAPAWILRERSARYTGLGADLRPTSLENFGTTIRKLRELAPGAAYDERFVNTRAVRGLADGIDAVDLLAHLLAVDLMG